MTALIAPPRSALEATYKAREVEGVLDLYFYRPIGFRLAQVFAKIEMKPAGVTLLAGLFGVISGHLFYYRDLRTNAVGMALLVCANALDNADGQLARLTHQENRDGRIIDSIADHLVFVSIYLHLTLRYLVQAPRPRSSFLHLAPGLGTPLKAGGPDIFRPRNLIFGRTGPQLGLD